MLIKNDYFMNIVFFKKMCKNFGIKNYSNLKKQEIFENINRYLAVKLIQRYFRNHFYNSAIDHITLEPVTFPCFIFKTKYGKHYFYNHETIIKYIMKTGNTRDPMTREEYSDKELMRLDSEAKIYYPTIKYRSTYKIKKNLSYARRIQNRENEILSFQMRMDEIKEQLMYILDTEMYNWDVGNEPIVIENVEYQSINSFINSVVHELKMVINNLRKYDLHSAELFKSDLILNVKEYSNINFSEIIITI